MNDMILSVDTLPETLLQLIKTEKVRLREAGGEIRIVPVNENPASGKFLAASHVSSSGWGEKRYLSMDKLRDVETVATVS